MGRKITVEIITVLFIVLWVYAGMSKLFEYSTFKYQLGRSPYIENYSGLIAWSLPLFEIGIAVILVVKKARLIGMYLSFFLMLLFTGYIYIMLNYSYFVPCSCGGILSKLDWNSHLIFNVVFTVLGLVGIVLHQNVSDKNHTPMKVATS